MQVSWDFITGERPVAGVFGEGQPPVPPRGLSRSLLRVAGCSDCTPGGPTPWGATFCCSSSACSADPGTDALLSTAGLLGKRGASSVFKAPKRLVWCRPASDLTLGGPSERSAGLAWGCRVLTSCSQMAGRLPGGQESGVLVCQEVGVVAGRRARPPPPPGGPLLCTAQAQSRRGRRPAGRRCQLCLICSPNTHPRAWHVPKAPLCTCYQFGPTLYRVRQTHLTARSSYQSWKNKTSYCSQSNLFWKRHKPRLLFCALMSRSPRPPPAPSAFAPLARLVCLQITG